jgi:hypothetical protein
MTEKNRMAKIVIYNLETGKTINEIPVNFWFSFSEPEIKDRHFNIGLEEIVLKEGEGMFIQLEFETVINEIKRAMRVK